MDNKPYYYMRLRDSFFDSDEMKLIQGMEDGYQFCVILLKLYLKSLRGEGRLMYRDFMPYNAKMIAQVTGHQEAVVEKALKVFEQMGLIEILDSGAIYMSEIQALIGKASTEADRKRAYRERIESEKSGTFVHEIEDKHPPEIRDKRLDIRNQSLETIDNNKTIVKGNINNINSQIKKSIDASGISDEVKDAVMDFVQNRKALKAPMTPRAVELMLSKLMSLSQDADEQIAILNQSIERGWKGVFALKADADAVPKHLGDNLYEDAKGRFTTRFSHASGKVTCTKQYDDGSTESFTYTASTRPAWIR